MLIILASIGYGQYSNITWFEYGPKTLLPPPYPGLASTGIGRIDVIRFHPSYDGVNNSTIFCGPVNGGIFRTTNNGSLWENLNTDQLPQISVGDIAIDQNNPSIIYFASGSADNVMKKWLKHHGQSYFTSRGIFKSMDDGNSWSNVAIGLWRDDPTGSYISAVDFWAHPSLMQIGRMIIHPANSNIMVVAFVKYNDASSPIDGGQPC